MDHPAEQSFQEPTDKKTRAGYGKFLRPNTPYDNFMESQGIPGTIQVTRAVYEQLKDNYRVRERGPVEVKGKGLIETWLLDEASSPALSLNSAGAAAAPTSPKAKPVSA